MKPLIPGYLTPLILTSSVVTLSMLLSGIRRALKQSSWSGKDRDRAFWSLTSVLFGWFAVALVTAILGAYHANSLKTPTIQYALLTPIVLGVVLFWRWGLLRRVLEIIPNEWLVGVQLYRVLGGVFLVLYATEYIPGFFALPASIGDVLVGLFAPFVAAAYARGSNGAFASARRWNFAGITDLVVAVTTGFLSSPSRLQLVAFDRPNNLITMFPLVMIPAFLVPLSVLLHFASLYKLRHEGEVRSFASAALATPRI